MNNVLISLCQLQSTCSRGFMECQPFALTARLPTRMFLFSWDGQQVPMPVFLNTLRPCSMFP